MTIDLNSDLGEGFGAWEMGNDDAMLGLARSVNVACFAIIVARSFCRTRAACARLRTASA